MQKLLIADCNEEFRLALAEALQEHYQVLCCSSGKDALILLSRETPDIFVLDLMLPELDGLTLLEQAAAAGIRPKVLAFASLLTDYVLGKAQQLGIGYLMRKPCDLGATVVRIRDLSSTLQLPAQTRDSRSILTERLLAFHISPKHNGYDYMIDAALLLARDPNMAITKELYPAVAKIHGCKRGHVERSIRSALEAAWAHGDAGIWQKAFPNAVKRPSNAVFLSHIAEALRRETE